ncbi:hypothetical protein [Pseudokordiimonas caeni]|uniref:hypothetical protein n=1 Tax=Pseudokordiimonas caeni TaxID=2997908 RepID=UPI0028123305|nr:hypothetical protein [Pseudokordiimonas caeni]
MHGFIRRRIASCFAVAALAFVLTGCAQMSRHSNMLVFGTNTTVGVNVGKDATQTPTIQIGFNRQEAALVPLLANTEVGNRDKLDPCDPVPNANDCHFRADNSVEGENRKNRDSYSVLASFGATAGAESNGAEVTVAQYFATGVAAQLLAESGGANVVQAGGNSGEIAKAAAATADKRRAAIEKEMQNAKNYEGQIDKGQVAAKAILGKDADPVTDETLKALADKIGVAGCSFDALKGNDRRTVKQFLAETKEKNFQCLARLARLVDQ